MENKRTVKRSIKGLQRVKTWQLVLLVILFGLISATFLRLNNIGMIERRTAVLNADEQGDMTTIQQRLYDLQRHTGTHMNADSGVVYLEGQYKRDTQKAIQTASASSKDNINAKADATCKQQYSGYSQAYVQCFASELAKYPAGYYGSKKAQLPDPSLYRHEFASPLWSPDFAGFSLLISAFLTLLIFLRLISLALLRMMLQKHYQSI